MLKYHQNISISFSFCINVHSFIICTAGFLCKNMDMKIHNMEMMNDSTHQMKEMKICLMKKIPSYEGVIDLETIDKNKDGKVYQDYDGLQCYI